MPDYTTTTNKLKITELDFDNIKTALKSYLEGQDDFKDYNFDGSAMSILLDVLAYNTHYNGFYTNMLASEMFLDSATLRSSIVSLAKHLGYTPSSRRGAFVELDLVFTGATSEITIPKNAKFTSKIGSDNYTFLATQARTAKLDVNDGLYKALNVEAKEGVAFGISYSVKGTTNEIFEIPNENIDISTLNVAVAGDVYVRADDITEVTATSKIYFLQEGNQNKYEIYFGDGFIGKKPNVNDLVEITYSASQLGSDGNGATKFSVAETLSGATSVAVTLAPGETRSSGGAERETTSSIRNQAPKQYGLQKRIVTANDYKTRLENDYNIVDSVRVWGGEENNPPKYGTVFVCIKPKTGFVLSNLEKQRIGEDILKKRNIVTVTPEFVDPNYLFIIIDAKIAYDPRKTTRTAEQIKSLARSAILNYSTTSLGKFDQYFRYSKLMRIIDDSELGITNSNMTIAMKKRIKPVLRVEGTYRLFFDNPIYRPHEGHINVIQSSLFTYRGVPNCMIIDRDGYLMIVGSQNSYGNLSPTSPSVGPPISIGGVIVEENSNVGEIDYETGEMLIRKFRPNSINDGSNYIYFSAKPRIQDIIPKQNTIVTIEPNDITLTCNFLYNIIQN